jgi:TAG lipase/steryl ester hydrolase/phospholipase A2/LPA acyltransferase
MQGGEHSTFPHIETIRLCTRISRTMEEILQRFESGDLRPEPGPVQRPRSSRRRPLPTRADREALREHHKQEGREQSAGRKTPAAAKNRAPKKGAARKKSAARGKGSAAAKAGGKASAQGEKSARAAA